MANKLTEEEKKIIIDKGTEAPFSGEYWNHREEGTYICKLCGLSLYKSEHKFDSQCGWPSFDDEIENAIKRIPDVDGKRTEIVCAKCGAHLGHIFTGEQLTPKDVRHCVNSLSMRFIPTPKDENHDVIYFAGGCFWGTEYYYKNIEGVISTSVGYIGGKTNNPTYKEVCTGSTGHAEVVEVVYDIDKANLSELVKLFFEIHDFTQINRQGPDIGEQYRTEIFYTNERQKEIADGIIDILVAKGYEVATITTKANKYFKAENYHQDYFNQKGTTPTCHFRQRIF